MRHSFKAYPIERIAPTCLYLALKVEERMQVKITNVARMAKQKFSNLGPQYRQTAGWEDIIAAHEETLLETLCFDLQVEQPLSILLKAIEEGAGAVGQAETDVSEGAKAQEASSGTSTRLASEICYET